MKQKTDKNYIKLYNLLVQGYTLKEDIEKFLSIKSAIFYKYLKQIKNAGFMVDRYNQSYRIKNFYNKLNMDFYEHSIFAYLAYLSYFMLPKNKNKIFENTIDNILTLAKSADYINVKEKYKSYKTAQIKKDYREKIDIIQKFIDSSSKIVLTLSNKKVIFVKPIEFIYDKEKVYLSAIDFKSSQKEMISLKNIVKIDFQKKDTINKEEEIVFELYGRLAKSYLLKDKERILDYEKDRIVVANSSGDKKSLFKRLLRYDTLCKVKLPTADVEEFKKLITKSLDNINKFQDNIDINKKDLI